jgi:hypothetical protein
MAIPGSNRSRSDAPIDDGTTNGLAVGRCGASLLRLRSLAGLGSVAWARTGAVEVVAAPRGVLSCARGGSVALARAGGA